MLLSKSAESAASGGAFGTTDVMQENTWARLRDSRPGARVIHAT